MVHLLHRLYGVDAPVRYAVIKLISLQCFDAVGRATGRAYGLYKAGCWFVGGDDSTGAFHVL